MGQCAIINIIVFNLGQCVRYDLHRAWEYFSNETYERVNSLAGLDVGATVGAHIASCKRFMWVWRTMSTAKWFNKKYVFKCTFTRWRWWRQMCACSTRDTECVRARDELRKMITKLRSFHFSLLLALLFSYKLFDFRSICVSVMQSSRTDS